ncbi:MAG: RagB/SusD family nutrient uptake outer membrane protein [Odoribacteraceae bacterium]|jgi:hypothetical protein|nr:RagB/SusD family nutrient uptake outer membrane protein [Odoribacteraceae bacterium]
MKRYLHALILIPLAILGVSCDEFFALNTDDTLTEEQNYTELAELHSGFLGVAATFHDVVGHTVVISELMGDLMTPTSNAGDEYWDIFNHEVKANNSVASPAPYYRAIITCNDFLRHALEFNASKPGLIDENTFHSMLAEVIRYRIWCYLTLGKIYNEAIYFDFSISDKIDLNACPVWDLDKIVEQSTLMMEQGVLGVNLMLKLDWNLVIKGTTAAWNLMGINPSALLGELYLWGGKHDKALLTLMSLVSSDTRYAMAEIAAANRNTTWKNNIMSSSSTEMVSVMPYSLTYNQKNMLPYYFSNVAPNLYYLAPTGRLREMYSYSANGDVYRRQATIGEENGRDVIVKYHAPGNPSRDYNAAIPLYRVADLYLMIAEAHNKLRLFGETIDTEYREIAMCFINSGLKTYWSGSNFKQPFGNAAVYATTLQTNAGIRGRIGAGNVNWRAALPVGASVDQTMRLIDSLIVNETALECAYEGKRWFTLVRMARHWNDPAFIADVVSRKVTGDNREAVRQRLMDEENWFIKYEHLQVMK